MSKVDDKYLPKVVKAIQEAIEMDNDPDVDEPLKTMIKNFGFGKNGAAGPNSILLTTAWYKWLNPKQNVRLPFTSTGGMKKENQIQGGYSNRSRSAIVTFPALMEAGVNPTKWCARESMMASRPSAENHILRKEGRMVVLKDEFGQRGDKGLQTSAMIIKLNGLSGVKAKAAFQLMVREAHREREVYITAMQNSTKAAAEAVEQFTPSVVREILLEVASQHGEHFIKLAVAVLLDFIYEELRISGLEDFSSTADSQSKKTGDLEVVTPNESSRVVVGIEVKPIGFGLVDDGLIASISSRVKNKPPGDYLIIEGILPNESKIIKFHETTGWDLKVFKFEEWLNTICRMKRLGPELIEKLVEMVDVIPEIANPEIEIINKIILHNQKNQVHENLGIPSDSEE